MVMPEEPSKADHTLIEKAIQGIQKFIQRVADASANLPEMNPNDLAIPSSPPTEERPRHEQ